MNSPEEIGREFAREWLSRGGEDLRAAERLLKEEAFLRTVAFHCQQAAEKYLKAVLVHHQIEFPKTHNLGELLDLIAPVEGSLADSLRDVTALNPYSVDIRYPGGFPKMTLERARGAVALAGKVRHAVLERLGCRPDGDRTASEEG